MSKPCHGDRLPPCMQASAALRVPPSMLQPANSGGTTHLELFQEWCSLRHISKHSIPPIQQIGSSGCQLRFLSHEGLQMETG